jgi:hypothetical protein
LADSGRESGAPQGFGNVCDEPGCSGEVEDLTAQPRHDARIDADAAGAFGKGDIANKMVAVFDCPVITDAFAKVFAGSMTEVT